MRFESKIPGQQSINSSELRFSGRVFIYHEYPLFDEQIIQLRDFYKKNGLGLQLLGTDYLWEVKHRK